jgi:esterase/lipase superfamily enzyme
MPPRVAPGRRDLTRASNESRPHLSQIVLAAPDVDVDLFRQLAAVVADNADGVSLYASANDRALWAARKYAGNVPRAGDVPRGRPIVLPRIDTIDASAITDAIFSLNHSGYADNRLLLEDIGLLLLQGLRPPDQRNPTLVEHRLPDGERWWQYPP